MATLPGFKDPLSCSKRYRTYAVQCFSCLLQKITLINHNLILGLYSIYKIQLVAFLKSRELNIRLPFNTIVDFRGFEFNM